MAKRARFQDLPLGPRPARMPIHRWLYDELRRAIVGGRLKSGLRLPSSRELARQQSIARTTVVAVFDQLQVEGYIASRIGSGTVVTDRLPDLFLAAPKPRTATRPAPIRKSAALSACGRLHTVPQEPHPTGLSAFRLHEPAIDCFPVQKWAQLAARRLRLSRSSLLQRGDPRGDPRLRKAVTAYLNTTRGVHCEMEQVVIVNGTQQAIDYVARLIFDPGDAVWVEEPGYPGAIRAFRGVGARIVAVRADQAGLDVSAAIDRSPRPKLVYITPAHQFPLGATLSLERRLALLDYAVRAGCWIFEDDYDGEYRYDARPIGALQGHDQGHAVIYAGSFNKMMFSALRLGYVVLPTPLVEPFLSLRSTVDRYPPALEQAVLADFMEDGLFDRHIRNSRAACLERRDALLDAGARRLAGIVELQRTNAGFHLLGRLPASIPDKEVQVAAAKLGVEVAPLSSFYFGKAAGNGLLLGFAPVKTKAIVQGVETLAKALEQISATHRLRKSKPLPSRSPSSLHERRI